MKAKLNNVILTLKNSKTQKEKKISVWDLMLLSADSDYTDDVSEIFLDQCEWEITSISFKN